MTFSAILRVLDEHRPQAQTLIMASKRRFLKPIYYLVPLPLVNMTNLFPYTLYDTHLILGSPLFMYFLPRLVFLQTRYRKPNAHFLLQIFV